MRCGLLRSIANTWKQTAFPKQVNASPYKPNVICSSLVNKKIMHKEDKAETLHIDTNLTVTLFMLQINYPLFTLPLITLISLEDITA